MKNFVLTKFLTGLTLGALFLLGACSKEDKNTSQPVATYTWQNGACYSNNQLVNPQLCAQSTNPAYYWQNNRCFNTANQEVPLTYCQTQGQVGGRCVGAYYYFYRGQRYEVQCDGNNCYREYLYNSQTNQEVYCP